MKYKDLFIFSIYVSTTFISSPVWSAMHCSDLLTRAQENESIHSEIDNLNQAILEIRPLLERHQLTIVPMTSLRSQVGERSSRPYLHKLLSWADRLRTRMGGRPLNMEGHNQEPVSDQVLMAPLLNDSPLMQERTDQDAVVPARAHREPLTYEQLKRRQVTEVEDRCFAGSCSVLTPNGERPISELRVGDSVFSVDVNTGQVVTNRIAKVHYTENGQAVHARIEGDRAMWVNPLHRFYTPDSKGWLPLLQVNIYSQSVMAVEIGRDSAHSGFNNQSLEVESQSVLEWMPVYSLEMAEPPYNFIVEGILVHNGPLPKII